MNCHQEQALLDFLSSGIHHPSLLSASTSSQALPTIHSVRTCVGGKEKLHLPSKRLSSGVAHGTDPTRHYGTFGPSSLDTHYHYRLKIRPRGDKQEMRKTNIEPDYS